VIKLNHLIKGHLIYEGLIHSVSIDRFEDLVNRWSISADKFKVLNKNSKIQLVFDDNITEYELESLIRYVNMLGWYVSAYLIGEAGLRWKKFSVADFTKDTVDKKLYSLQLEAKYDLELNGRNFDFLYHSTPSVNDDKINSIGLVPKSRNKIAYHPDRVYFTRTETELDDITERFHSLYPTVKEYSYYQVDIKGAIHDDGTIRLFNDPNTANGIYTLSNIPKQYLSLIKKEQKL
jgi:hypothetical protein